MVVDVGEKCRKCKIIWILDYERVNALLRHDVNFQINFVRFLICFILWDFNTHFKGWKICEIRTKLA